MNNLQAIEQRQSRRTYQNTPISVENLKVIEAYLEQLNKSSGLCIQLIRNGAEAFKGLNPTYGMFSGVQSYIALVGKQADKNLKEKAGYYGELVVLEATKLGLGTCWVGATYNKSNCPCILHEDETLVCIITIGNVTEKKGLKENTIYKLVHRGTKAIEDMYEADAPAPDYFISGMKAVQKAPSAVNKQPVFFRYFHGKITAEVKNINDYQAIDLGIAKAHFEIGAGGKFGFGNGAEFVKSR